MERTVLSFYLDDTNPHDAPPEAFGTFLDFCASEGVKGESSVILGYASSEQGPLSRPTSDAQHAYIDLVRRAYECGFDSHMELMTHAGLFDFDRGREPEGVIHEGLWLHEPEVSVQEYESYFDHIVDEGARIGIQFSGVTWPGCDCPACQARFAELRKAPGFGVNPHVCNALLELAKRGRFRGRAVPCFTFSGHEEGPRLMAGEGDYGVWDLMPNAGDMLGSYTNSADRADPDYYISEDGGSGRLVELVDGGAPYAMFYAHWQGLNPANGVGWEAFTEVVRRAKDRVGDRIEWLRPSEYAGRLQQA